MRWYAGQRHSRCWNRKKKNKMSAERPERPKAPIKSKASAQSANTLGAFLFNDCK